MRHYILSFFILLSFSFSANAQMQDFFKKINSSCAFLNYSYSSEIKGTKIVGDGDAFIQSSMFIVNLNGIEFYGDGQKIYTVDRDAKEVIISNYDTSLSTLNPVLLLSDIEKTFSVKEEKYNIMFDGMSAVKVLMIPKVDSEIVELNLYFIPSSSKLIGLNVKVKDGTVTNFTIPSILYLPLRLVKDFHPGEFDSSYVITEL